MLSQAVICSEKLCISLKTWEKLCCDMDGVEFKHKLQETLDWQMHQQPMILPKQKAAAQNPTTQGRDMPSIMVTSHAREWEQE